MAIMATDLTGPAALCVVCDTRPRWCYGAISRCKQCLQADVAADHRERKALQARVAAKDRRDLPASKVLVRLPRDSRHACERVEY
jgi:hypothetical protein